MGAREDIAKLATAKQRAEYRANAARAAVLARKPQSGPLTAERNGLTLIFDDDPQLIRDKQGRVIGVDAMVRAFRAGNEIKIDPHRLCVNPPLMVPDGTFTDVEALRHGKMVTTSVPNYREDPWEAYLDWLFANIEEHPAPKGWRTRGTVTTVYAGTADGGLESRDNDVNQAFDGIGDALTLNASGTSYTWIGSVNSGGNYYVQMALFPFDTSAITGTVSDAVFSLYGRDGNSSRTFELRAWISNFGVSVTTADWHTTAQLAALPQVAHYPSGSTWSTSGYNDFTDDALPANVSVGGTTYIIVSDDLHETATAPTVADDVSTYMADQSGTTKDPKLVVTHAAGGGTTVTPGVLALTTSGQAPTVTASDHKSVTPSTLAHTTSLFAPTVTASDHKTVTPSTLSQALSLFAPTVTATANQTVTPDTLALALSLFAATVTASGGQTVTPGTLELTLSLFAATVSAPRTVTPDTLSLSLNANVPDVLTPVTVTPGIGELVVATFAPVVTATAHQSVTPATLAHALTLYATAVTTTGHQLVTPSTLALALSLYAATVTGDAVSVIGLAFLADEPTARALLHDARVWTATLRDELTALARVDD